MVGKQLTASEFQLCRRLGNVYHCPNMNLVNKDLKTLCLYNIYSQTTTFIEDTCEVKVTYSEKSCGAAFDLPVSNLGREPGSVGAWIVKLEATSPLISGVAPSSADRKLSKGLHDGLFLRPDTRSRGVSRANHSSVALASQRVVRRHEQGAGPQCGDEVHGRSRSTSTIHSIAEIPQQAAGKRYGGV